MAVHSVILRATRIIRYLYNIPKGGMTGSVYVGSSPMLLFSSTFTWIVKFNVCGRVLQVNNVVGKKGYKIEASQGLVGQSQIGPCSLRRKSPSRCTFICPGHIPAMVRATNTRLRAVALKAQVRFSRSVGTVSGIYPNTMLIFYARAYKI